MGPSSPGAGMCFGSKCSNRLSEKEKERQAIEEGERTRREEKERQRRRALCVAGIGRHWKGMQALLRHGICLLGISVRNSGGSGVLAGDT